MKKIVAALQIGADEAGKAETLSAILAYEPKIIASGASVVVMPEALLGGYPKGEIFGTRLGYRTVEGRETYRRYYDNAVDINGPEVAALASLSVRTGAVIVAGIIERDRGSLYCTAIFLTPEAGLVAKHRKLMPTGTERLVWRPGDGSTLPVVDSAAGKLASAICWENHMPLFRAAMYAKGVELWCAPTVDDRDIWQCSMRHIAHEGRCFVISACQFLPSPATSGRIVPDWNSDRPLISGGSVIVGPLGDVLAGPLTGEAGLITAIIDTDEIVKASYDLNVSGHYSRPDVFSLTVNEAAAPGVSFETAS